MDAKDKIKFKINALLSKTVENGASEAEAISALNKAYQLMKDYFISENDLKDPYINEHCIQAGCDKLKSGYDLTLFLFSLKMLFDCESFFNKNTVTFFGFEQDVKICIYFYGLISEAAIKEAEKYKKSEAYLHSRQYTNGRTLVSSFIKGFQISISEKMDAMFRDRESSLPQEAGIVLVNKKARVDTEFKEKDFNLKNKKYNHGNLELDAINKGKLAGEAFNIIQGVDSAKSENTLFLN